MSKGETTKKVISKWNRTQIVNDRGERDRLQQVVYKTEIGKNKKGKTIFSSKTRHERV